MSAAAAEWTEHVGHPLVECLKPSTAGFTRPPCPCPPVAIALTVRSRRGSDFFPGTLVLRLQRARSDWLSADRGIHLFGPAPIGSEDRKAGAA